MTPRDIAGLLAPALARTFNGFLARRGLKGLVSADVVTLDGQIEGAIMSALITPHEQPVVDVVGEVVKTRRS